MFSLFPSVEVYLLVSMYMTSILSLKVLGKYDKIFTSVLFIAWLPVSGKSV